MSTEHLVAGDPAPDFTLPDADGNPVTLSDLRGKRVVVYFYPKASTPGCTIQACDFRDNLTALKAAGVEVLGISADPQADLVAFRDEQNLNFPLLSDVDRAVVEAYGNWGTTVFGDRQFTGVLRSTFVVAPDGTLEKASYRVQAQGHVAELRNELGV